jgi:IS1 family transposase
MTGVAKNTIVKLLADVGKACADYQDNALRNIPCRRIQCDEIWSFCGMKEKNVPEENKGQLGYGDAWTFVALCADSKLAISWLVGRRDFATATTFMKDVAGRLKNRVQLTTDGHKAYLNAVDDAFGKDIDRGGPQKSDSRIKCKIRQKTRRSHRDEQDEEKEIFSRVQGKGSA